MTELCQLAFKYRSDKCPQIRHCYTLYYHELFKDRRDRIKKVFEMGIGTTFTMKHSGPEYQTGASLRMWRDYFPKAMVYGADIDPRAMFEDDRIKTFVADQTNPKDVEKLIKAVGSDIDIFIDDGAHRSHEQLALAQTVLPMLKDDVVYIIEDVFYPKRITTHLPYTCTVPKLLYGGYRENLVVVSKK